MLSKFFRPPLHSTLKRQFSLALAAKKDYWQEYKSDGNVLPQFAKLFRQKAYINGQWVDSRDGKAHEVLDPATNQVVGTVPLMNAHDTRDAISAAEAALPAWRSTTAASRSKILKKAHALMLENTEFLARLITIECGKPLAEARGEVGYAASFFEWFAEEGRRAYGDVIPTHNLQNRLLTIKQPIGVVGLITPWNFPSAMITRKLGPAIAAGCTAVCKPAPDTPYSALALCQLLEEAGLPPGVFNVVTSDAESSKAVGTELCDSMVVRKISFTGSTAVGKWLLERSAHTVKRVSMELGGNAPFIVFDDADLNAAVDGAIMSKLRFSGQTCVCANRILVQEGVHDEFVSLFAKKVAALNVGHGFEDGVNQGPLINASSAMKVGAMFDDAAKHGATVVGERSGPLEGNFFNPTILTNVTPDMRVFKEEIFGPLCPVFRFKDEAEAIAQANATNAGLATYFYTRDLGRIWRVSEALEYGMVGINTGVVSTEIAPFGGVKESGLGREGSKYGLDEYLETKYLCMAGM